MFTSSIFVTIVCKRNDERRKNSYQFLFLVYLDKIIAPDKTDVCTRKVVIYLISLSVDYLIRSKALIS